MLVYNGAAFTFLIAAVLMTAVGVASYRQMDDRKGTPLMRDLGTRSPARRACTPRPGCFVALEGGEGAGKSTQARLLARLAARPRGTTSLLTREPGDTGIGQKLRDIVLDPATGDISHRTEALLYAADKAEHVDRVVAPGLARGAVVVTDRYVDSTLAYQGAGRDLVDRDVERVARWATGDLRPHLTVVLDLPPQQGLTRFEERDRIEAESVEFHERVRRMFLQLATGSPEHYLIVDARRSVEEIAGEIRGRLRPLLDQAVRRPVAPEADHQPPAPAVVDAAPPQVAPAQPTDSPVPSDGQAVPDGHAPVDGQPRVDGQAASDGHVPEGGTAAPDDTRTEPLPGRTS